MSWKQRKDFREGKEDIHVEDKSEFFSSCLGLYFSFIQQSGSGWLYSTTKHYPCTLFNLGVLNWELSLQLVHSLRPTCVLLHLLLLLVRPFSQSLAWASGVTEFHAGYCFEPPIGRWLQKVSHAKAAEMYPDHWPYWLLSTILIKCCFLPLLLRQTMERVTAWGKGTNSDKHEGISVVRVLAI